MLTYTKLHLSSNTCRTNEFIQIVCLLGGLSKSSHRVSLQLDGQIIRHNNELVDATRAILSSSPIAVLLLSTGASRAGAAAEWWPDSFDPPVAASDSKFMVDM